MNPDNQPSTPTAQTPQPKAGWRAKLKRLNAPAKLLVLLAAVFAGLIGTGLIYQAFFKDQAPTPTPQISAPAQAAVSITEAGFIPATIKLSPNTQLTWTNNDTNPHQPAADPHPLNNSIEGFEQSSLLQPGDSYSFTFENSGTYTLHDHLNPLDAKYRATVVVE